MQKNPQALGKRGLTFSETRNVPMDWDRFGVVASTQQLPVTQFLVPRPEKMTITDFERSFCYAFKQRVDYETLRSTWGLTKKPSIISAEPNGNVIYKGLMAPSDLAEAFPDLKDPLYKASQGPGT